MEGDDDGMFEISSSELQFDGQSMPEFEFLAGVPLDDMSVRQEDVVLTKSLASGVGSGVHLEHFWMDPYVSALTAALILAGVILRNTVFRSSRSRRRSRTVAGAIEPELDTDVQFSGTLLLRRLDDLEGVLATKNAVAEESCLGLDVDRVARSSSSLAAVVAAAASTPTAASATELATLSVLERVERVIARLIDDVRAVQRSLPDASHPQLDFLRDRIGDFQAIARVLVTLRQVRDALEQRLYVQTKDPLEEARAALQQALDDEEELQSSTTALVVAMAACAECGDKASELYLAAASALEDRHAAEDDRIRQSLARRADVEMRITTDTMSMASMMLQNGRAGAGSGSCGHEANPFASCLENGGVNRTLTLDLLDAADETGDSAQPVSGPVDTVTVAIVPAAATGLVMADRQPHALEALVVPFALELNKVRRDLNNELERSLLEMQKRRDTSRESAQRDAKRDARQREQEARETAHRHKLLQEQRSARSSFDEELHVKWRNDVFARHDAAKRRQLEADFYYVVVLTNAVALLAFGLITTRCRLGHGWALQQARCLCAALSNSGQGDPAGGGSAADSENQPPQGFVSVVFSLAGRATGHATLALVQLFQGWDGAWMLHDLSVCAVKTLLSVLGPLLLSRLVGLVHKSTARLILLGGVLWTLWEPASLVFASLWQTCLLAAFNCGYYYLLLVHCDPRLTWAEGPKRGPDWRRIVVYVLAPTWLVALSLLLACEATSARESRGLQLGPRFTWETARAALARAFL